MSRRHADEKPAHLHLAFTAESRQQVAVVYRANCYAAFVIGPNGHNLGEVCHAEA